MRSKNNFLRLSSIRRKRRCRQDDSGRIGGNAAAAVLDSIASSGIIADCCVAGGGWGGGVGGGRVEEGWNHHCMRGVFGGVHGGGDPQGVAKNQEFASKSTNYFIY